MISKIACWCRRTGLLLAVLLPLLCLQLGQAEAGRVNEVKYFKSYQAEVDGQQVTRLEFGLKRDNLEYTVKDKRYLRKQIVLELQNTKRGDLDREKRVRDELVSRITAEEPGSNQTRIAIEVKGKPTDAYKVYTLEEDRSTRKPYRLIVDIYNGPIFDGDSVEGVEGRTIVIDPGHGGSDSGAVGPSRVTEKSVTLSVSKKLQDILKMSGANVAMTRETDKDVWGVNATDRQELQARVDVAERTPGTDIFVSIHCNAFSNPQSHGMETYYYDGSYQGKRLATLINEELEEAGGLFNRGVKTANFYVIKHSSMPSTLLELAFITNPHEEDLLVDEEYQQKLAQAIARGISRYFLSR